MTFKPIETTTLRPGFIPVFALCFFLLTEPGTTLAADAARESPPPTSQPDILSGKTHTPISPEELEHFKELADQLYESHFEYANDFQKSRLLEGYLAYYLETQNIEKAIEVLEQLLSLKSLDEDSRYRAEKALNILKARASAMSL